MNRQAEELGNFPQIQVNSIGEKLIIETQTTANNNWTWLNIRRLPLECFDSGNEIRNKILGNGQDLHEIDLW